MSKCNIISTYIDGFMHPFGDSLSLILDEAFRRLGYDVEIIKSVDTIKSEDDDIVLFIMPPERYVSKYLDIKVGRGRQILWNLEPISFEIPIGNGSDKWLKRAQILDSLFNADGYNLDAIWLYDKEQFDYFRHPKSFYVPIGFANCLTRQNTVPKGPLKKRRIAFVGSVTGARRRFFKVLDGKLAKQKNKYIKIMRFTYANYSSQEVLLGRLGAFHVAIDIRSSENIHRYVRWHRLMLYAGARMAIVSDTDLSQYGFVHGKHYLYFQNAEHCAIILEKLMTNQIQAGKIAENMVEFVSREFMMNDILTRALEKLHEQKMYFDCRNA